MRMVRIGGVYMPEEMAEYAKRQIDNMRDPFCTVIEEELKRTERERNETMKKEHEALKKECEKLRHRNEELTLEIEQYKRKIASIRDTLGTN